MIRKKLTTTDLRNHEQQQLKAAIELPGNSSSLRKLLSSHSSIYNALANPELDEDMSLTPELSRSPKLTSRDFQNRLPDLQFSITSWQSVSTGDVRDDLHAPHPAAPTPSNNNYLSKRPTSSILLSISDDNDSQLEKCDSTILIPYPKRVMVFETDEEEDDDEDDEKTLHATHIPKKISSAFPKFPYPSYMNTTPPPIPLSNYTFDAAALTGQDSFIMPKMSVSDNSHAVSCRPKRRKLKLKLKLKLKSRNKSKLDNADTGVQISILLTKPYQEDTRQLIAGLAEDLSTLLSKAVHIRSYLVDKDISDDDVINVRQSDLVLLINDGSFAHVEKCVKLFPPVEDDEQGDFVATSGEDLYPKVVLVNLITVNYFINLFELINSLKPYQLWKTSSLKVALLRSKIKDLIAGEIEECAQGEATLTNTPASASLIKKSMSSYAPSTISGSKKLNYKKIEKKFKSELQYSTPSLENVDPLLISNKFSFLNILSSVFNGLQATVDFENYNYGNLWVLCSFSLGIGLGVGLSNGTTTIFGVSMLGNENRLLNNSPDFITTGNGPEIDLAGSSINRSAWSVVCKVGQTCKAFKNEILEEIRNSSLLWELSNIADLSASYLYSLNLVLLENIKGGLEKVFGLFMYINY